MSDNQMIKPCPHCGGQAKMSQRSTPGHGGGENLAFVECLSCKAQGPAVSDWVIGGAIQRQAEALAGWNLRVGDQ